MPSSGRRALGAAGARCRAWWARPCLSGVTTPVVLVVWVAVSVEGLRGYSHELFRGVRNSLARDEAAELTARGLDAAAAANAAGWLGAWRASLLGCNHDVTSAPHGEIAFGTSIDIVSTVGAALCAGWLTARVGRRAVVFAGVLIRAVGQLVGGVGGNYALYAAGFALHTVGSVLALQAMLIEVIEVSPAEHRGKLAALTGAAMACGWTLADSVVYGLRLAEAQMEQWHSGFRLSLLLALWPSLMLLVVLPWMLDTPGSLLQRGRIDEARQALQSLRGELADIRAEFEAMLRTANEGKGRGQLSMLLSRPQLPSLFLVLGLALSAAVPNVKWLIESDVSDSNFLVMRFEPNRALEPFLNMVLAPGVAYLVGALVTVALADRVGCRRLLIFYSAVYCLCGFALAGLLWHREGEWKWGHKGVRKLSFGLLYVLCALSIGGSPTINSILTAELLTIHTRSAGVAMYEMAYFLGFKAFRHAISHTSCVAWPVIIACTAGVAGLSALFAWLLVPDTTAVPLDAIPARRIYTHWLWRRFAPQPALPRQRPPAAPPRRRRWRRRAAAEEAGGGGGDLAPGSIPEGDCGGEGNGTAAAATAEATAAEAATATAAAAAVGAAGEPPHRDAPQEAPQGATSPPRPHDPLQR
ncbi:hypothetical protein Rsub_03457 [Raphidocelis subcapitata]|uniref:Major facilitator superfamily (MFS) profile domain-containing protein n=1 Tax=Raphidocelis subcapitata TaxID=307507 RepID=A0A2V0NS52_9CHLO|nr:hypothetical protein Rsub_03457 [Raphidocelis subcapitata]|eukprot:GBF90461.1 hypothetical protein Rsub_03457 [Raphidocelis subcapitata]